jgi:hypothetical protein
MSNKYLAIKVIGGITLLVFLLGAAIVDFSSQSANSSPIAPASPSVGDTYNLDQEFYNSHNLAQISLRFGGLIAGSGSATIVINRFEWYGGAAGERSIFVICNANNLQPIFTLEGQTWKVTNWSVINSTITLEKITG